MNVGAKIATKDDVTMVTVGCGYLRSGQDYLNCDYSKPETQQVVTFCQKTGKLALLGIINYSGGSFKPNQTITRQETATMLMRLAKVMGLEEPNASRVSFTEQSAIASWFADGVRGGGIAYPHQQKPLHNKFPHTVSITFHLLQGLSRKRAAKTFAALYILSYSKLQRSNWFASI